MHYLNLSDHTHLELQMVLPSMPEEPKPVVKDRSGSLRVRWDKCDVELYKDVVHDALSTAGLNPPSSHLDADISVRTITSILDGAAKAASPLPRKKKSKKGYPIWNDKVAAAVQMSKKAHYEWKRAGRPRGESSVFKNKKEARKYMRQVLRMTLCEQKQELLTEIMTAKDTDVKLFHRLIKKTTHSP